MELAILVIQAQNAQLSLMGEIKIVAIGSQYLPSLRAFIIKMKLEEPGEYHELSIGHKDDQHEGQKASTEVVMPITRKHQQHPK